ncbi:hypothetical protein LGK97_13985 [Clostridium sp. CS001]|uniref:hypothetical protein n=1 Tax=Clostridium sp. CS001 TaxID=2880648 RepID=UPI001CF5DB83|nr:hypothetical protein [Clostridium sp. CS001]MCB2290852.1 hypothetical protein [Clostridium sp. CS001]
MKTTKEFIENIRDKVITMEMVEMAVYSLNKRAKNCRDNKNKYYDKGKQSNYKRYFDTVDKYKAKEREYYSLKDFLLKKLLKPTCIHMENLIYENEICYYSYDDQYEEMVKKAIYCGSYFDEDRMEMVDFIDVIEDEEISNYYLFYETNNYSFHIPINISEANKMVAENNIKIIEIENLVTKGKEINDLISVQFINKIIELIKSEDYQVGL